MEGKPKMEIADILELVEKLYKHNRDYREGRTQNFSEISIDCRKAAEAITQLMDDLKRSEATLRISPETEKEMREIEYHAKKIDDENTMLKECIVRMALGRYGVLNE